MAEAAVAPARDEGCNVTFGAWEHESLASFRRDLRACEVSGPDSVEVMPDFGAMEGLSDAEVLVVQFCPVPRSFFESHPAIRLVGVVRAGVENVDLGAARDAGAGVVNVMGRNAQAVAEYTVAMLLAELRDLARSHVAMAAGKWEVDFPGSSKRELRGSTVGIVGAGRIGTITAGLLLAFGCRVLVHDPFVSDLPEGTEKAGLDELFERSDHVVLHARLSKDTEGMIGKRQLSLLKPHSVLVNTARAGLVDEGALVEVLREHRIGGAALDVFNDEPLPEEHPLHTLENVTYTPHLACETEEAAANGPRIMSEHVMAYLKGGVEAVPCVA